MNSYNDYLQLYVEAIAIIIAFEEGYFNEGTIPNRNNNPGDLRSWGNNPIVDGFVKFPTAMDGWQALMEQVRLNIERGLTLREFFRGKEGVYAGYDKTNPRYAFIVAKYTGIPLDRITIADYIRKVAENYALA